MRIVLHSALRHGMAHGRSPIGLSSHTIAAEKTRQATLENDRVGVVFDKTAGARCR